MTFGDISVCIVKDNCYANALDVTFIDHEGTGHLVEECSAFKFKAFKFVNNKQSHQSQHLACSVKICQGGIDCDINTVDDQCPIQGDDAVFQYTIQGA